MKNSTPIPQTSRIAFPGIAALYRAARARRRSEQIAALIEDEQQPVGLPVQRIK